MSENEHLKLTRRRGMALEHAILEAAWNELVEHGYADFTLEGIAKRADTSRTVLSRRWTSRADLAAAAIKQHISKIQVSVPDLGNLREELLLLMHKLSDRGVPTLVALMLNLSDYFAETHSSFGEMQQEIAPRGLIEEIVQRGIARGEIDPARLTARIIALPIALLRHESMMTLRPASEAVIAEIIDQIFLPLVSKIPRAE